MTRARSLRPLLLVVALAVLVVTLREPNAAAWGGGSPTWVGGPLIPFAGATNGQCLVSSGGQWVVGTCSQLAGAVAVSSPVTYFVDPANSTTCASDANTVNQATCGGAGIGPWLTWHHLNVDVWGCGGSPRGCPRLRATATVTFQSSHSNNADPVVAYPSLENGASLILQGNLAAAQQVATGTYFGMGSTKNRATGAILTPVLAASAVTGAAVGELLVNATHSSRSWLYKTQPVNPTFAVTQPLTPSAIPYASVTAFPAEVDTSAIADAWTLYNPTSVNVVDVRPVLVDFNGSFSNGIYLSQLTDFDPQGAGADAVTIGPYVYASDVRFDRGPFIVEETQNGAFTQFRNCYFDGGWYGGTTNPSQGLTTWLVGGTWTSASTAFTFNSSAAVGFDGDFYFNPNLSGLTGGSFGFFYIETGRTLSVTTGQSFAAPTGFGYVGSAVWGPGALNVGGNARLSYATPATSTLLLTGTITLNGNNGAAGTPILCNTAAAPGTLVSGANAAGFTLTPTHLSAACGGTGFGDRAFNFGQASIIGSLL